MTPINIYFYSPTQSHDEYKVDGGYDMLFINTVPVFLDSYIRRNDVELHKRINWSKIALKERTQDQLICDIEEYNIDVVCFSLYFWNNKNILEISKGLKQRLNREVLILAGGPSINVVRDKNYNRDNPDFDYTIYAQGERPFYDILKHKFDNAPLNVLSTKNSSWIENGKLKKADYDFYRLTNGSPYTESKHILEKIVTDAEYANITFTLPYETTKGCPYNCSFCDWTSGLSHKVAKRKFSYELDIELFQELGIHLLYFADANFGIYKEDKGIIEHLVEHNRTHDKKFTIVGANYSKTKKHDVYDIIKTLLANNMIPNFKVSVQDTHLHILENIERPDIPWDEHMVYVNEITEQFPWVIPRVEIIQGLPGQTRKTWENMLIEMSEQSLFTIIYKFIIISNSPASYDTEWRDRMKIQTSIVTLVNGEKTEAVTSTYSFDKSDYAYFNLLSEIYNSIQLIDRSVIPLFPTILQYAKEHEDCQHTVNTLTTLYNNIPESQLISQNFLRKVLKSNIKKFSLTQVKLLGKYIIATS
jgi:putative methyltransferase